MDNDLAKNHFSDYFLTMANPEAPQLSNLAAKLADRHLKKIPQRYSEPAITAVLVIKRVFRLTLRAAQGFIDSFCPGGRSVALSGLHQCQ